MLKKVKSIFRQEKDPLKSLSDEQKGKIFEFENNLNMLTNLPQNHQIETIKQLSVKFINVFECLTSDQVHVERIFKIYQNYISKVTELSELIFAENQGDYYHIFNNFILMKKQFGSFPDPAKFSAFYFEIIKVAKNGNIKCLKASSSLAKYLFQDESFFKIFSIEIDGLTSIFTAFFIPNNKEAIDIFIDLLFLTVPPQFYVTASPTTLEVCRNSMLNENCPRCALFLSYYLALLSSNSDDNSVINTFYSEDGFTCLNSFLVQYCDSAMVRKCYEILLIRKGKAAKAVLRSMYEFYISNSKEQEMILDILINLDPNDIQNFVPIHMWVLHESSMKIESILKIISIMLNIGIVNYLDNIFTIIENFPKYKNYFIELIFTAFFEKGLNPDELNQPKQTKYVQSLTENSIVLATSNSFIYRFVLKVDQSELLASLIDDKIYFKEILLLAYSTPGAIACREEVLSKIVNIFNTDELTDLVYKLIQIDITCEMYILLLSNLLNPLVANVFIAMLNNRICPFDYEYFISQSGFNNFDILLEEQTNKKDKDIMSKNIIRIIGKFTRNGPRKEIDEWILRLPNDSVLFNKDNYKLLAQIAIDENTLFLNVPSLLLFLVLVNEEESKVKPLFDITSPACLYNAGKYGIPMFLKRNMKIIESVPYYNVIVNRYINPTIYNEIADDYDHYQSFLNSNEDDEQNKRISLPNFELFELYFSEFNDSCSSIVFRDIEKNGSALNPIYCVDFRFIVPSKYENNCILILKCDNISIYYSSGNLIFKTNYQYEKTAFQINDNAFARIRLLFNNSGKINIKALIEPIESNEVVDDEIFNIKPFEKSIDSELSFPYSITFGGRDNFTNADDSNIYRLIFDRYIYINNRLAFLEMYSGSAFKIPFSGFYSYLMSDKIRIESIFMKLEELQKTSYFTQIFKSILLLIKYLKKGLYDNSEYLSGATSKMIAGIDNVITKQYLLSRLLYSIKRSAESISDNILVYLFQLPSILLNKEDFSDFICMTLIDFEIYFLFNRQFILSYLNLVKNDISLSPILANKLINNKTSTFLISIIRRTDEKIHISDELLDIIVSTLIHIGNEQSTCLNRLFTEALAVSYWKFPLMSSNFMAKSIMEMQQIESPLQLSFLNALKTILKNLKEPRFAFGNFVLYSLFFNDQRSFIFFEIIANYSYRILHYVDEKCSFLNYAFARFADNEKAWLIAFTILGGFSEVLTEFPKTLTIKVPLFSKTILFMLIHLLSLQALSIIKGKEEDEYKDLANKVLSTFLGIPINELNNFSTDPTLLSLLSNFGLIPNSLQLYLENNERTPFNFSNEEIKMSSIDFSMFKDIDAFQTKEFLESSIQCIKLPTFDVKLDDCEWVNKVDFPGLISFITNIILTTDFSIFSHIAVGNALMSSSYQKLFAKELIINVLDHFQNLTKNESSLKKSIGNFMSVVSTAARSSIFSGCYLKFLIKVFDFLKKWCFPRNPDQSFYSKDLQNIVLYSLYFITDEDELTQRNKLLNDNKNLIFSLQMTENYDYANIMNYCVFLDRKDAERLPNATQIVERLSQIDKLITPYFRINEFSPYYILNINSQLPVKTDPITISSIPNLSSLRVLNSKKILEFIEKFLIDSSRLILSVSAYRAIYAYLSTTRQFEYVQINNRILEQKLFKCIKDQYIYKQNYSSFIDGNNNYEIKSYYLSQIAQPYYSPRNVAPSPFAISSPPLNEKVYDFSFYMLNKDFKLDDDEHDEIFKKLLIPYQYCQDISIFKHSFVFSPEETIHSSHEILNIEKLFDPKTSQFKYSSEEIKGTILHDFITIFGNFSYCFEVDYIYFVHKIPSLLFVQEGKLLLLLLSSKTDFLISKYDHPIILLPLNQSVLLHEFHDTSLFCGHYVLSLFDYRLSKCDEYYYTHEKKALSLYYVGDPNIVIVFKSTKDVETILAKKFSAINKYGNNNLIYESENFYSSDSSNYNFNLITDNFNIDQINRYKINIKNSEKKQTSFFYSYIQSLPRNSFFITLTPPKDVILFWLEHEISTFDYLAYLNMLGGRSFSDLTQYPVFPWVGVPIKKNIKIRDLSKPMGQLAEERARHFDDIYEGMKEYFYGCHYSNPAITIYYLMRLPPFNYFSWDLNNGWDSALRFFYSIVESYIDASTKNSTDVKELIPELYSVPMALTNESNLNCTPGKVELPKTQSGSNISPSLFTSINRKNLEDSYEINLWIDLIFGYKQSGPEALKSKNLFMPTSYHNSTPQSTSLDENVFQDYANNFGQCPKQLFELSGHPSRTTRVTKSPKRFAESESIAVPYSTLWCNFSLFFRMKKIDIKNNLDNQLNEANLSKRKRRRSNMKSNNNIAEPNLAISYYLSLSSPTSTQIFDSYFINSGISKLSHFVHFNGNSKQDGLSYAIGNIEIRWKLVNTDGLIIPLDSTPIIPNGIEKYMDPNLLKVQKNDWFSFYIPFISTPQENKDPLQNSCFVVNYESDEIITIRKISYCYNSYVSQIFNSKGENQVNLKNLSANILRSSSELMAVFKDNDGSYLNHLSVSYDALYIVASYDNGLVKVFRIEYDKSTPQRIRLISLFSQSCEVLLSKISSRDMLVFSILSNGRLVIWNFASGLKHREFDLGLNKKIIVNGINHRSSDLNCTTECDVVDIINDDFEGYVSVLLTRSVIQFSSNGTSAVRKFTLEDEAADTYFTSMALYPLDFSFDKRIIVVGDSNGSIYYLAVSSPSFGRPDRSPVSPELLSRIKSESIININASGEDNENENANENTNENTDENANENTNENTDENANENANENTKENANKGTANNENDDNSNSGNNESSNSELVVVKIHKNLMKVAISSIFIDREAQAIIVNDIRGGSAVLKMENCELIERIERCDKCLKEKTSQCSNCKKPICPTCNPSGLCNNCRENTTPIFA